MKTIKIIFVFLCVAKLSAQDTDAYFADADIFFAAHVTNGRVDYKTIKNDPSSLDALLVQAAAIRVTTANADSYKAFWINTYNLAVIKGVISKYPVKSPLKIGGFFDNMKYEVGGIHTTLNDIENKLLRAKFPSEPRFHFTLVCAGLGCPPIIGEAYAPAKLEAQLQRQTVIALNNPNFIRVKGNKVQLSQIFEWYKEDFIQNGSEVEYINTFRKEAIPVKAKVSYYPYDWTLNASK
ncbi:MAG: hypothetical protein ACI828_000272 [Flavobacteriales bacterium]|jgi:hypothetical protein